MNNVLMKKQREEYKKSLELSGVQNEKCPFEVAREIRKKQNEAYKKYKFFNQLSKAIEKSERNERSKGNFK